MAKKKEKQEYAVDITGMKLGAAKRCNLDHCKGNPKKIIKSKVFDGYICEECFCVLAYRPQEDIDAQNKIEYQEEKLKRKQIAPSEAELEKLIKEADKKDKKKIKKIDGEQGSLF
jgi:hypothetical protein